MSEFWNAILEFIESDSRAPITIIPRPYKEFEEELASITQLKKSSGQKLYFNSKVKQAIKFSNKSRFSCAKVVENCVYQSLCAFQVFDEDVLATEIKSRLDRLILRERILDDVL